jgi:large subunit ribosomal protein L22
MADAAPNPQTQEKLKPLEQYRAHHYFADVTARKLRPFAHMLKGLRADEALEALKFEPNRAARLLEQVVLSAVGNAQDRGALDVDELEVLEARVDGGPILKRIRPRARGMAFMIKKRLSHIHISLVQQSELEKQKAERAKAKGKSGRKA